MYQELLKKNNLSVTRPRLILLKALDDSKEPLTIEELKRKYAMDIDTSTIYRSLKSLVSKGIVYQTDFREGVSYFELQKKHHHHIICTECKKYQSIDICIDELFPSVQDKTGFVITNHMFEIFGICKNCS